MFSKDGRGSAAATVVLSASTAMAGVATLTFLSASLWIQNVQDRWSLMERSANHISWIGKIDLRLERKVISVAQTESAPLPLISENVGHRVKVAAPPRLKKRIKPSKGIDLVRVEQVKAEASPFKASVQPAPLAVHQQLRLRFQELAAQLENSEGLKLALHEEAPLSWDPAPAASLPPQEPKRPKATKRVARRTAMAAVALPVAPEAEEPKAEVFGPHLEDPKWILSGMNTHTLEQKIRTVREELLVQTRLSSPTPIYSSPIGPEPAQSVPPVSETLARSEIEVSQVEDEQAQAPSIPGAAPTNLADETALVQVEAAPSRVTTQSAPQNGYSIAMTTQMDSQRWVGDIWVARPSIAQAHDASRGPSSKTLARNEARTREEGPEAVPNPPGENDGDESGMRPTFVDDATQEPEEQAGVVPLALEALTDGIVVEQAEREVFAADGSVDRKDGAFWTLTKAFAHWPTLSRTRKIAGLESQSVDLISESTLRGLGELSGAAQGAERGVVFGKLPKGWRVQLSGIAEPAQAVNGTFFFLNVQPGAAILYVTDEKGNARGGLPLPVLAGVATYVPDAEPFPVVLAGRTLDGTASEFRVLGNVRVEVVGQPEAQAVSIRNGSFRITNAVYWPGFPLWVDVAEQAEGEMRRQRHRMEVESDIVEKNFYVMSELQLSGWMAQLSGGVSPDSALALSALPRTLKNLSSASLETFEASTTMDTALTGSPVPETYVLSNEERLVRRDQLSQRLSRTLTLELPAGVSRIQVSSRAQQTVFSELILPTPKVLCVIGPH